MTPTAGRPLRLLGEGIYSVSEVCRILQPSMTPRKVHYWLDKKDLLGEPVSWGEPGHPTLLTFEQLLRVRTVQHLREELQISLPRVREAFAWILDSVFADEWLGLTFARAPRAGHIAVRREDERVVVPIGQGVLPSVLPELEKHVQYTRSAWETQRFVVPGFRHVESNPQILGGSPVAVGTRIETIFLANFLDNGETAGELIPTIRRTYPVLSAAAIRDALRFEGLALAA